MCFDAWNVSVNSFGKLFSYTFANAPHIYAQPLYVPNVSIRGQLHNVLYVATELDSVLALDADQQQTLWQADLAANVGGTPVDTSSNGPIPYGGCMGDLIGICGTPVIDPASGTLYLMTKTQEGPDVVERLHALDITTGAGKFGRPVKIQATIPGQGTNSSNGISDPLRARRATEKRPEPT